MSARIGRPRWVQTWFVAIWIAAAAVASAIWLALLSRWGHTVSAATIGASALAIICTLIVTRQDADVVYRLVRSPAAWAILAAAIGTLTVSHGLEQHGATRWLAFPVLPPMRSGLWMNACLAMSQALLYGHARNPAREQRIQLAIVTGGHLVAVIAMGMMPDAFSIAMLQLISALMAARFRRLKWLGVLAILALGAAAFLLRGFRWHRLMAGLDARWLDPGRDPLGQGYALLMSRRAFDLGGYWGRADSTLELPLGRHADWFGFAHLAFEFGTVTATLACALAAISICLAAWAACRVAGPAGRAAALCVLALLTTSLLFWWGAPLGLLPFVGHFGAIFFGSDGTLLYAMLVVALFAARTREAEADSSE